MTDKKEVQVMEESVPTISQQETFFTAIERLASNPEVDVEKIQRIMDMQEHVLDRNAKQAFNAAMVRAQMNMPTVPRDLKNQQTNSKYSAYETILKYTKPIYTAEGFSVLMYEGDTTKEGNIRVCADVMHEQGHTEKKWTDVPIDDKGIKGTINKTMPHAKKSSLSYGKGILMCMIFNIPTGDDDDGNGAGSQPDYITEEQVKSLEKEIKDRGVDLDMFLTYMATTLKIDELKSLEYIPAAKFNVAMGAVTSKKKEERILGEEG